MDAPGRRKRRFFACCSTLVVFFVIYQCVGCYVFGKAHQGTGFVHAKAAAMEYRVYHGEWPDDMTDVVNWLRDSDNDADAVLSVLRDASLKVEVIDENVALITVQFKGILPGRLTSEADIRDVNPYTLKELEEKRRHARVEDDSEK